MKQLATLLAMLSMATPASASIREAAFASSVDRPQAQTSMFAGATLRVGLDGRAADKNPRAALKLSGMTHTPGRSDLRLAEGLEISGGRTGKPALYFAGQDAGELQQRAKLSSGAKTALIIGGIVVVGVVVAFATMDPIAIFDDDCECD